MIVKNNKIIHKGKVYLISGKEDLWYVTNLNGPNSELFDKRLLYKNSTAEYITKDILGYDSTKLSSFLSDFFPWCKSKKDIIKLLKGVGYIIEELPTIF